MTTLLIARHGNTFSPADTPLRVGGRTDLPLVESGQEQARALGRYLRAYHLVPDAVYASVLRRTQETARLAVCESGLRNPVYTLDIFNEIDYGPDEGQPEDAVAARIGAQALKDWDERAAVPPGWLADPASIIRDWQGFAAQMVAQDAHEGGEIILVVTSNGIARFAPHITGDFEGFRRKYPLKLATGALGILEHDGAGWHVRDWNVRP